MLHGWINFNKPTGISSAFAVNLLKRRLRVKKAGHSGTLDPLASGVLPIAVGEATKVISYVVNTDKNYEFTVQWGANRTTDDSEGEIVSTSNLCPQQSQIESALTHFIGDIQQIPPTFSAIKCSGIEAYKLARSGQTIELKPRLVHVSSLKLLSCNLDSANFSIKCSKGVYIRSIARDLGNMLGCLGYISQLKRTKVGGFDLNNAISLENFNISSILPLDYVLTWMKKIEISAEDANKMRDGCAIYHNNTLQEQEIGLAVFAEKLLALCQKRQQSTHVLRLLHI